MSLTKKASLNIAAAFLQYGTRIVVQFLVTPILVSGLGESLFGIWQMLGRIVGYISAADGRPTQALKWVIANNQNCTDQSVKRKAIGSALGVLIIALPIMIIIGVGLAWFSPHIIKVQEHEFLITRITCLVLVANLVLTVLSMLPESVLYGMNLGYKRMVLVSILYVFGGGLSAGAVFMGYGIVGVAVAQVIQTGLLGLLYWFLNKKYLPWFGAERVGLKEIKKFFKLSFWYSVWNLVNKLLVSSDLLVLGIIISSTVVTHYALTNYAAQTIIAIITMIIGSITPGLGGYIGQKNYKKVSEVRYEMILINLFFSALFGCLILFWNQSFISLWVGHENYLGPWINFLLVLVAVQFLFIRNDGYIIDVTLSIKRKVVIGFISSMVSILCAMIFIRYWGIIGCCLGFLAGRSILSVSYPLVLQSIIGKQDIKITVKLIRPLICICCVYSGALFYGQKICLGSWIELILCNFLMVIVFVPFFYFLAYTSDQRQRLLNRINIVTQRFRKNERHFKIPA